MRRFSSLLLLSIALFAVVSAVDYKVHQSVEVHVNNVGPDNNPTETYNFYSLPFCKPNDLVDHNDNLGDALAGHEKLNSLYDIRFGVEVQWAAICNFELTQNNIHDFRKAIKEDYIFEIQVDDLPVKGYVGQIEDEAHEYGAHSHQEKAYYLNTHLDFAIYFNGPNVIAVNMTTNTMDRVPLEYEKATTAEFSYSVSWHHTNVAYEDRMDLHTANLHHGDSIHWLAIMNSFVLVMLLLAFVFMIFMNVLKKDLDHLNDEELQEDGGWKLIHGDVFRPPQNYMLFAAIIGTGSQIFVLAVVMVFLAMTGTFYHGSRGTLYTAILLAYALTSFIAGFVSTRLYCQFGGQKWASNAVLTAALFVGPFFLVFCINNSIAIYYGASPALPFGTILALLMLWALVALPMTIMGSMRGKSVAGKFESPCNTHRVPREIPPAAPFQNALVQMLIAGFMPFSSVYVEVHFIFGSVWGNHVITLFGILGLAFVMLLIVNGFVAITLTYFQLNCEDWHWWWRQVLYGSSPGIFLFGYAWVFFHYLTEMDGVLQSSFFFGYVGMICYGFSLMLSAVSYWSSLAFMRYIYALVKGD